MPRDSAQSFRHLVTQCKNIFRLKLGADPPANVKHLVIKLRKCAEPVRMSAGKNSPAQLKFMRDKIRELDELGLVLKEHWSRVNESSAHPSEAWARSVSYVCRSVCTERVKQADSMDDG
jgi:hypothetical protein